MRWGLIGIFSILGLALQGEMVWTNLSPVQAIERLSGNRWKASSVPKASWQRLPKDTFFPFIDVYGQFKYRDWEGKTHSDADLQAARRAEEADLQTYPGSSAWNRFGGWAQGPKCAATGRFRVEKVDGKWWFVDPEGRLFWSHGIVRVTPSSGMTPLEGRDDPGRAVFFDALPKTDSPLARFYQTRDEMLWPSYEKRGISKTFDFSGANLYRKYGENWFDQFADLAHRRLRSWGMNTIANSSDLRICLMDRTPYAERLETRSVFIEGSTSSWWKFRDPFDPSFRESVRKEIAAHGREIHDPWCLGFFIDNEIQWGKPGDLARWTIRSSAKQAAKVAFCSWLKKRYQTVAALNRAWGAGYADWDGFLVARSVPEKAVEADLVAFGDVIAETYFRENAAELKKADSNILYFGCRFSNAPEFAVRAAAKYCDVLSYNLYRDTVDGIRLPAGVDKPILIGEFHFGARDRGPFCPGLIERHTQQARANAYQTYVLSALRNPLIVGAHWHQFADQATTGRFDGENFQVGFVDICDKPYAETIQAARGVGYHLYSYRDAGDRFHWEMTLDYDVCPPPKGDALRISEQGQSCRLEHTADGALRVVYDRLVADNRVWDISLTLEYRKRPTGMTVNGAIQNRARGWRVNQFVGPFVFRVPQEAASAGIFIPNGLGVRVNRFPKEGEKKISPWVSLGNGIYECSPAGYSADGYPSVRMTMPWLTLCSPTNGLYFGIHEPEASAKSVKMRVNTKSGYITLYARHHPMLSAGAQWEMPETVLDSYEGTWKVAAKRYRAYYDSVKKVVQAPSWVSDVTGWLLCILKQQNEEINWPYTEFEALGNAAIANGCNCIGLFGWTVGGHDHLYPDYDPCPKMGGREKLRAGIARFRERGLRSIIYANGQLEQRFATEYWFRHGKDSSLTRRDNGRVTNTYHKFRNIPVYVFELSCLHAESWYQQMLKLAKQANDLGADGILYDQWGMFAPFECYGEGHGHLPGAMSYAQDRVRFAKRLQEEMARINPQFAILTEGLHDSLLDSISFFHGCEIGTFLPCAISFKNRSGKVMSESFPELFRYTFPELKTTTRVPTPVLDRNMANYALMLGLRHDLEVRYLPDVAYIRTGVMPPRSEYRNVVGPPNLGMMETIDHAAATAYMQKIAAFQSTHKEFLLRGRFVDTDGFVLKSAAGVVAKRFVGAKGGSAVLVWNKTDVPQQVDIQGLGKALGAFEPEKERVQQDKPLSANSIRLVCFGL